MANLVRQVKGLIKSDGSGCSWELLAKVIAGLWEGFGKIYDELY